MRLTTLARPRPTFVLLLVLATAVNLRGANLLSVARASEGHVAATPIAQCTSASYTEVTQAQPVTYSLQVFLTGTIITTPNGQTTTTNYQFRAQVDNLPGDSSGAYNLGATVTRPDGSVIPQLGRGSFGVHQSNLVYSNEIASSALFQPPNQPATFQVNIHVEHDTVSSIATVHSADDLSTCQVTISTSESANNAPSPSNSCVLPSGLNVCRLGVGDILFAASNDLPLGDQLVRMVSGTYWFHAAIYIGNDDSGAPLVAEATGPDFAPVDQIRVDSLTDPTWSSWMVADVDWAVLRPQVSEEERRAAADYAHQKASQKNPPVTYNLDFANIMRDDAFYCSQLVWRAYYEQGTDLRVSVQSIFPPHQEITPDDIFYNDSVYMQTIEIRKPRPQ